jgi:hypothetical protein
MPSAARIKRKRDEGMENNAKKYRKLLFQGAIKRHSTQE